LSHAVIEDVADQVIIISSYLHQSHMWPWQKLRGYGPVMSLVGPGYI